MEFKKIEVVVRITAENSDPRKLSLCLSQVHIDSPNNHHSVFQLGARDKSDPQIQQACSDFLAAIIRIYEKANKPPKTN
jgi:hypothetical protein